MPPAAASPIPPLALPTRNGARARTREKADSLLRAAAALIAEKGFEATAIRDVGRRLQVSLGGMYYYFDGKDDLLFQIQYRTFEALLAAQERAAAADGDPVERLRRLLAGHLVFFERHPNEMKICTYELESLRGERYHRVLAVRRRYFRVMADAVGAVSGGRRTRRSADRVRHATLFVFGMLNWAFMWYQRAKDGPVEQLADEMMDLLLGGLTRS
jgi:AcrR family transcriptional regulator